VAQGVGPEFNLQYQKKKKKKKNLTKEGTITVLFPIVSQGQPSADDHVLDQGSDMPVVLSLREAEAEDHLI
jgi:hypothetical protein